MRAPVIRSVKQNKRPKSGYVFGVLLEVPKWPNPVKIPENRDPKYDPKMGRKWVKMWSNPDTLTVAQVSKPPMSLIRVI